MRRTRTVHYACAVVMMFAWLGLARSMHAQVLTSTVFGTVTDESKAILPGVTATITSSALPGGPASTVCDAQGRYRFPGLGPGMYTLTLTLGGFTTYTEALRVAAGGTVERNVGLTVATLAETITVSGRSPMVDTRNVAVAATQPREVLENLPTIRVLVTDYLQAVPGVAAASPGQYNEQVKVMGSPSNATTYVHDGVVINNPVHGNSWSASDIDAVEEIQTVVLGASAEYQVAAGGVVNVVTKSGTNNYRLDSTAYWKPDSLQSEPLKVSCGCPLGKTGFNVGKNRDWSAHFGGPIIRDRLWYFGGYRSYGFTDAQPGTLLSEATIAYWNMMPSKFTWQINRSLRFSQLLHLEWYGGYGGAIPSRSVAFAATTTGPAHIHSYGNELNKTFGAATIFTVRAGGWWEPEYHITPRSGDLVTSNHTDNFSGFSGTGAPNVRRDKLRRDAQSFRLERYVAGNAVTHNLRGGLQIERGSNQYQESLLSGVRYFDFAGAPDYALFQAPFTRGATFATQGGWAEDQLTIGNRVTLSLGLRFDRMHAISQDLPVVDAKLDETGATVKGLGSLFVWKVLAPRVGLNLKLTQDGQTVVRAVYGRSYREIVLNEWDVMHPGITDVTQASVDPATGKYSRVVSVTNSRSNIAADPNIAAPYYDTLSVGVDRQLMPQVAISASYVYKNAKNLIGWRDIGGVYGTRTDVLADGRQLTVLPLLNSPSARRFLRTNRANYSDTYNGFVTSLTKRLSHRWQGQVNLTLSTSKGLAPLGGAFGQDPNDDINAVGRINDTDRPVMFTANASYDIPRIEVRISGNYQSLSNKPWAPQASVLLPQGRRSVNIDVPGSFRADRIDLLFFRFDKIINLGGHRKLELIANVVNLLQNQSPGASFFTFNYFSPQYAQPSQWVRPRQMYVGARVNF